MKTFDFAHYGEVKRTKRSLDRIIDFETGAFQVQKATVNPIVSFEVNFQGTKEFMKEIEAFWDEHGKSEKFYYVYDNETYTCQFTSDYSPTDTWGWTEQGKMIAKIAVTLTMRVCRV